MSDSESHRCRGPQLLVAARATGSTVTDGGPVTRSTRNTGTRLHMILRVALRRVVVVCIPESEPGSHHDGHGATV